MLTSGQLSTRHVEMLVSSLHALHSYGACEHTGLLYANHGAKVRHRFETHENGIYSELGLTRESHFDPILLALDEYELERRALPAAVIHGDPVLTNILLPVDKTSGLKLIDMRGAQGDMLTLEGDAVYDLAKLLQSLLGYDVVLGNRKLSSFVAQSLTSFVSTFFSLIAHLYPSVKVHDVTLACAALYTSLIPLHDNLDHQRRFAIMGRIILDAVAKSGENMVGDDVLLVLPQAVAMFAELDA